QALILTAGGPNNATLTLVLLLYREGFQNFQFGYASAIAWGLFCVTFIFAILVVRTSSTWVHYEGENNN
ncbi:MAG: ABC transporter permease, partial [Caldilineaceae bacterium]|nr:ABC transporter permease [Caldilineaceae bacterium]